MVLPCIEVKRFDESMFCARGYCNRRLQCYRPTMFWRRRWKRKL